MKFFVISILLFFLCGSAFSLKCYECNNEKNTVAKGAIDVACNHPEEVVCGDEMVMCAKISTSVNGQKIVSKTCTTECQNMQSTIDLNGTKIDADCCQGNLCNASEKVSKNKSLFSAVAVYAYFKLFF